MVLEGLELWRGGRTDDAEGDALAGETECYFEAAGARCGVLEGRWRGRGGRTAADEDVDLRGFVEPGGEVGGVGAVEEGWPDALGVGAEGVEVGAGWEEGGGGGGVVGGAGGVEPGGGGGGLSEAVFEGEWGEGGGHFGGYEGAVGGLLGQLGLGLRGEVDIRVRIGCE